jgi:hypothetical protein
MPWVKVRGSFNECTGMISKKRCKDRAKSYGTQVLMISGVKAKLRPMLK